MRQEQAAGAAVGESSDEYGGGLRRIAYLAVSVYCWLALGLTTLTFYALMWAGSLLLGPRRSFRRLMHTWAWFTLKIGFFRIDVAGLHGLPRSSVLAVNHQHYFDIILLAAVLPPPFVFVSRAEVLKIPIVGSVLKRGGHVLVQRGAGVVNETVLREAVQKLEEGAHVIFFPEGTRSRDGRVRAFKSGVFRVAAASGRPLVPVTVAGSRVPITGRSIFNVPSRLGVSFLAPRQVDDAAARSDAFRGAVRDEVAAELLAMQPRTGMRF